MRAAILALLLLAAAPATAAPVKYRNAMDLEFEQLGPDRYVLSQEEEGARSIKYGQMKIASICKAAGGAFSEITRRTDEALEFTIHADAAPGRDDCAALADARAVKRAAKKLTKMRKREAEP